MKFSYPLLKKFVPALKSKEQAINLLTLHSFEAEDAGGNTIEVKLPPNRYADCSGHVGIAREIAATLGGKLKLPPAPRPLGAARAPKSFSVKINDAVQCPRYASASFEGVRVGPSPAWLASALADCGLRPISNVVDVMNYVMLETGQPLHAFDLDKLEGRALVVRPSRAGERIVTIDGQDVALPTRTLVVADAKRPQAIAGVKGGKAAEVTVATTRILVEAANFDATSVYLSARAVNILTDAAQRFARGMPVTLPGTALARAAELLAEVVGAKHRESFDSRPQLPPPHVVVLAAARYERLIGMPLPAARAKSILTALGFTPLAGNRWQVPTERLDIDSFEDLAEEVARLVGYGALPALPPRVALVPPVDDPSVAAKSRIRTILSGLGYDEVYTNSFVSRAAGAAFKPPTAVVYLENPMSDLIAALRPSLALNLVDVVEQNARFFDACRAFEVGAAFQRSGETVAERLVLGCVAAAKKREMFFELKGALERLLEGFGLRSIAFVAKPGSVGTEFMARVAVSSVDDVHTLTIMAEETPVGYLGVPRRVPKDWRIAIAEIDVRAIAALASGNIAFAPLPAYPSVIRDISCRLPLNIRIGEVMRAAQKVSRDLIEDVDLVDEYVDPSWKGEQSITLRLVFQAKDRTLTSDEVDRMVDDVARVLTQDFRAVIR